MNTNRDLQYIDNIYAPSYEHERKTNYFKNTTLAVAMMTSFFISLILSPIAFFIRSQLDIDSYLWNNYSFIMPVFWTILIVPGLFGLMNHLTTMLRSYKIENHKITVAMIDYRYDLDSKKSQAVSAGLLGAQAASLIALNVTAFRFFDSIETIRSARVGISHNTNLDFVKTFFDDDDVYIKRKTYNNPVFIKETKTHLVYKCDEKTVKIPKVYPGLGNKNDKKVPKISERIVTKTLVILLILLCLEVTEATVSSQIYADRVESASTNSKELIEGYSKFGYSNLEEQGSRYTVFRKKVGKKRSNADYYFDSYGNISSVEADLYYSKGYKDTVEEIKFLVSTLPAKFNENELEDFYQKVSENISGKQNYLKLTSTDGDFILVLSPDGDKDYRVYFRKD